MKSREKIDESEALLGLAKRRVKMLVSSLARAPLSVSHDASRAVNLLYCRSPSGLTQKHFGHHTLLKIFSIRSPREAGV